MKELKIIKDEVKRVFQEMIVSRKVHIDYRLTYKQKNELSNYLHQILVNVLRMRKIKMDKEVLEKLKEEIISEYIGYGVIEKFIKDPKVTDILVNSPNQIFIEKEGELEKVNVRFRNEQEIINIIERALSYSGRRLDMSSPFVDLKIKGGIRVTAVIPPISLASPSLCIRKILQDVITFDDLVKLGTLDKKVLDFLRYSMKARLNILISGSTGAGKTTFMNLLIRELISPRERIVIIEDNEELSMTEPHHYLRLLTRSPNVEGKGEITLHNLVKLALHLRPDRIIIGEVRGEEAFHFLHATNTGHEGSMCTIHANGSEDALVRLETLSLMDRPNISQTLIRRFLKLGIDLIIHMIRFPGGKRVISQISEFDYDRDQFLVKDIFTLQRNIRESKEIYEIKSTGHIPSFMDRLKIRTDIPHDFFE